MLEHRYQDDYIEKHISCLQTKFTFIFEISVHYICLHIFNSSTSTTNQGSIEL